MEPAQLEFLRRLTLSDEHVLRGLMRDEADVPLLDEQSGALAQLAALVAIGGDVTSFQCAVDAALAAGVDDAAVVGVLLVVAPVVGLSRVCAAAGSITVALQYQTGYGQQRPRFEDEPRRPLSG